jgi:hypothetical protein
LAPAPAPTPAPRSAPPADDDDDEDEEDDDFFDFDENGTWVPAPNGTFPVKSSLTQCLKKSLLNKPINIRTATFLSVNRPR